MRQALTLWLRHKASFVSLVAVLSVAIGVVMAVWAIASAIWWQPLPFPDPDRVVSIGFTGWNDGADRWGRTSVADYLDWCDRQRVFAAVAAFEDLDDLFVPSPDGPVSINAVGATANLFDVLRLTPILGRTFTLADGQPNAPPVAVISQVLWRSQFGGDPTILDRRLALVSRAGNADRRVLIVGVLPTEVPYRADEPPANLIVAVPDAPPGFEQLRGRVLSRIPIGRLADGVSMAAAIDQTTLVLRQVDQDSPSPLHPQKRTASLIPLRELLYGSTRGFLSLLGLASLFVLAVACANSVGACLALGSRRGREFAVRVSLGASRLRLARQSLSESSVVAAVAAASAIFLAHELLRVFVAIAPVLPRLSDVRLPVRAGVLACAVAGGCGLLLAMAPLVASYRRPLSDMLQASSHTSTLSKQALRNRRLLLATQVAVVLALMTASGLVIRTLRELVRQPLGFNIDRVLSAEITPTRPYFATPVRYQQLITDVLRDVRAAPGGREAAVAFDAPLSAIPSVVRVDFPDGAARAIAFKQVSDGFFRLMRIPMLSGRDFLPSDDATGRFLIVNESFARAYFGDAARTVGHVVRLGSDDYEIVGVVADVRDFKLTAPFTPTIYPVLSAAKWTPGVLHLLTREQGDLRAAAVQVRAAVFHADPSVHVTVEPLEARMRAQTATARFQADALGALAAFTLLLAAFGTYALVDQIGHERAKELALRAALGAGFSALVRLVLGSVLSAAVAGVTAGAWLSWVAARAIRPFLFHTSPLDGPVWIAAAACLAIVSGLAAWMPARMAAGADPAQLLRQD